MKNKQINTVDADGLHDALRDLRDDEDPIFFLEVTRRQIEAMNVGSLVDRLMAMSDSRMQTLFDGFNALAAMHAFNEETIVRLNQRYASILALQFG